MPDFNSRGSSKAFQQAVYERKAAEIAAQEAAAKEADRLARAEAREIRRERRERVTLGIALTALLLSVLSLVRQFLPLLS